MPRRSLRDPDGRQAILERLARLTPDNPRHWGVMEPATLLPHLASGLRMALGERTAPPDPGSRLRSPLRRYLALYILPWPEGRIETPPGAFSTPSQGWERDRDLVFDLIERFATAKPEALGAEHPAFGRMSQRDWDALQYRHLDHHLRQFGC
jgi:hypothetical protein